MSISINKWDYVGYGNKQNMFDPEFSSTEF